MISALFISYAIIIIFEFDKFENVTETNKNGVKYEQNRNIDLFMTVCLP